MRRTKFIIICAIDVLIIILLIMAVMLIGKDKKGPVITIPSDIEYHSGITNKELLEGVTAVDKKDGDVSDTLIVKSVIKLSKGNNVKITYAAKDSHNNVTEKSITLTYDGSVNEKPTVKEEHTTKNESGDSAWDDKGTTPDNGENVTTDGAAGPGLEETSGEVPQETTSEVPQETTSGYPEGTTPVETVSPEAPVLYLTKIEDWIQKGSEVNWVKYVNDITDDKDDRDSLFRSIMIDDYPDMNTVGDYDVKFYCKDSDGNPSPKVILHIHIID